MCNLPSVLANVIVSMSAQQQAHHQETIQVSSVWSVHESHDLCA